MTTFSILTLVFFQGKPDFCQRVVKNGLVITISPNEGRFLALPLVMTFFKILKNHEKGPKTVPKLQKREGKWKKGIKNLTLEFNQRGGKWSVFIKCGWVIGFFQKKPDFDPRDSASKILINPKNDEKMPISNDFLQKLPGWRKMVIR